MIKHTYIKIKNRKIGLDYPPLVIAEIGINHNGDIKVAKKIVDAATRAGCEMVKHQTHVVEDEMIPKAKQVIPGNSKKSIYEVIKEGALNEANELELKKYVEKKGMIFISTPFSRAAFFRLKKFNVPAYKVGSGECNNYPLLELIAKERKPIILSTGMNNIESIKKAVNIFKDNKCPFAILHTTNIYPTPQHLVRLNCLKKLKKTFKGVVLGLSDHTLSNHACFGAVALGASILERHFTDTKKRAGPDIACSMDEKEAKELIEGSSLIWESKGDQSGKKTFIKEEKVTIDFAFAAVVSTQNIKKGELFTEKNIWVKRPMKGGLPAEKYFQILGKKAKKNIDKDRQIKKSDFKI